MWAIGIITFLVAYFVLCFLRDYVEDNERIKSAVRTLKAIQEEKEKRRSADAGQG
jgi:hypothetical protein